MFEVLKKFKYSPDGLAVVEFKKGDKVDIVEGSVKSLVQGGYIKPAKETEVIEQASQPKIETKPAPTRRGRSK